MTLIKNSRAFPHTQNISTYLSVDLYTTQECGTQLLINVGVYVFFLKLPNTCLEYEQQNGIKGPLS